MGDGRDLASLAVPTAGELIATNDRYGPYLVIGPDGTEVGPVTEFFRDLLAAGRSGATVRSYGMLCRARHKWAYADAPVMPRRLWVGCLSCGARAA
jgi:hypothetical protein